MTISRAIRSDTGDQRTWQIQCGRLHRWHLAFWMATIGLVVYGLHWPQVVRYDWGLDKAIVIKDLLILAPVWIPLLCSWAAFYEVESALRRRYAGSAQRGNIQLREVVGRGQFVWLRTRHYLGLCLLPLLALLAFHDCIALLRPDWPASEFGWLLYLVPILVVTLALPPLLKRIWRTASLPEGPLRSQLQQLTLRTGVRTADFRIWQTGNQLLNAAVTGLIPSLRYVFITDALLALLRDDEIASIISHELGHVRRRHLWYRMLLLVLPIWVLGSVRAFAPSLGDQYFSGLAQILGSAEVVSSMIVPALAVAYTVIAMGLYSRILEHDADLCVFEEGQAEVFCTTIDRLSYMSNERRERATWLHPSTTARVHLLQRAVRDPSVAHRFRRRVNQFHRALLAVWILTPVGLLMLP